MHVVSHHAGHNAPGGGGRQRLSLFFSYCKGWKLAWKPSCVAGDYKTFSFQIWFFPCEFCLLAQRQDASWTAPAEVVLITVLENVLWLGITAAWEEDSSLTTVLLGAVFQEQSVRFQSLPHRGSCWQGSAGGRGGPRHSRWLQLATTGLRVRDPLRILFWVQTSKLGQEFTALLEPSNCSCDGSEEQTNKHINNIPGEAEKGRPCLLTPCCPSAALSHPRWGRKCESHRRSN